MKGRVITLGTLRGRTAAAMQVDGRLEELLVDGDEDLAPGAICRAVADRPMKGMGGMFVKLPGGQGFLRQTAGVAPGQSLLVQITGPAEPGKALPVTTRLLFKSRHAILTPGAPGCNISRRIRDEDARAALGALATRAMAGASEDLGLILRSVCEMADDEEIEADIAELRRISGLVLADTKGGPELLIDAPTAAEVAWRDWADPAPDLVEEDAGAFERHGVLDAVEALLAARVDLPGAGHMMLEPTRALLAIDVNTGPDTSPAASLKANLAAARDLPRQLRLRGLGGQIVVDFAPMPKRDRAILDQSLKALFKNEGAETSLVGWTTLGLYEIARKRDRIPLREALA